MSVCAYRRILQWFYYSKTPLHMLCGGVCVTGNNLSSQAASSPVLSTRGSLTAVFGMGTGGASQPSSPDLNGLFRLLLRQTGKSSSILSGLLRPSKLYRRNYLQKLTRLTFLTLPCFSNQALDGLVPVRSIHCCTYTPGLSTLSSPRRLTDLCHERSHLGVGFTLRCFQRLSDPDVATQRYAWRHNWYTIGPSTPVLSY